MNDAVSFAHFIQYFFNVNVARVSNKILLFLPTFSSLLGTANDDIDTFITAVRGANSGCNPRISIPVGVLMHLKVLCFEFYYRKRLDALSDVSMLEVIDISQLIVMRSTRNKYARDSEGIKHTSLLELRIPKFTTSNSESFMDDFKSLA